jgi:hypothetical protein
MALMALSAHLNWLTIPQTNPKAGLQNEQRETSFVSTTRKPATHGGKMLKLITWTSWPSS